MNRLGNWAGHAGGFDERCAIIVRGRIIKRENISVAGRFLIGAESSQGQPCEWVEPLEGKGEGRGMQGK